MRTIRRPRSTSPCFGTSGRENNAGYTCIKLTGAALRTETLRLSEKYQDIVIDTGGRDTTSQRAALSVADVLLVPFVPRSFDVWTLEKVARVVGEVRALNSKLIAYAFLNRADPRGQDNEEAATVIRDTEALTFLDTPLGTRKAFANAGAIGLSVCELLPNEPKATRKSPRCLNVSSTLLTTLKVSAGLTMPVTRKPQQKEEATGTSRVRRRSVHSSIAAAMSPAKGRARCARSSCSFGSLPQLIARIDTVLRTRPFRPRGTTGYSKRSTRRSRRRRRYEAEQGSAPRARLIRRAGER